MSGEGVPYLPLRDFILRNIIAFEEVVKLGNQADATAIAIG